MLCPWPYDRTEGIGAEGARERSLRRAGAWARTGRLIAIDGPGRLRQEHPGQGRWRAELDLPYVNTGLMYLGPGGARVPRRDRLDDEEALRLRGRSPGFRPVGRRPPELVAHRRATPDPSLTLDARRGRGVLGLAMPPPGSGGAPGTDSRCYGATGAVLEWPGHRDGRHPPDADVKLYLSAPPAGARRAAGSGSGSLDPGASGVAERGRARRADQRARAGPPDAGGPRYHVRSMRNAVRDEALGPFAPGSPPVGRRVAAAPGRVSRAPARGDRGPAERGQVHPHQPDRGPGRRAIAHETRRRDPETAASSWPAQWAGRAFTVVDYRRDHAKRAARRWPWFGRHHRD
jgi:hypothetical protein